MTIDEFIEIVYPKLKMKTVASHEFYTGKELRLTGHKDVNGEEIRDTEVYKVPTAAVIQVDHRRKLRLAWLRGGKSAVRTYLTGLIPEGDLNKVMTVL
jgi:hypothetical protein